MPDIFTAPKEKKTEIQFQERENASETPALSRGNLHSGARRVPGLFAAMMHDPEGFTFANQEKGEKILIFTRRHFFTNAVWIFISIIAVFIPLIAALLVQTVSIALPQLPLSFLIILILFYYLVLFGYAFFSYAEWFYNIGIITRKRMIDIDFSHLSFIDLAITQLAEIEDVVYTQQGFFASYFDYGYVVAHTVATIRGKEDFIFENIPHPEQVVDLVSKRLGE